MSLGRQMLQDSHSPTKKYSIHTTPTPSATGIHAYVLMTAAHGSLGSSLLHYPAPPPRRSSCWFLPASFLLLLLLLVGAPLVLFFGSCSTGDGGIRGIDSEREEWIEAEVGVVAADDGRCSEIGASALRRGGHAVDAAVATALCLGVVNPASSGVGGGAFMVVRSGDGSDEPLAFDSRETAPLAASQVPPHHPLSLSLSLSLPAKFMGIRWGRDGRDGGVDGIRRQDLFPRGRQLLVGTLFRLSWVVNMYAKNPSSKQEGGLSAGVPGELAGLHAAWSKYGRLPWKSLFQPSIKLARDGFTVASYLASKIKSSGDQILNDPGLRKVFAPNGRLLVAGDTCYNVELSNALEVFSVEGPRALYNGSIGEAFVRDVRNARGVITMDDMRSYKVKVTKAVKEDVMGFTLLGMPPPSSGTVGTSLVLNILGSYGTPDAVKGPLGLHRFVEALKHMFAIRMNLGDPDFVNTTKYVSEMLSFSFAKKLRAKIFDNTTFDSTYYMPKWSQLMDHGTSHFCIVDAHRNAVSMTSTVNHYFGAGVLSPSTGIVLNDEMDDFSTPTETNPGSLPPAPANFIEPKKRPLSSMTPLIILKDNQLAGVIGASGGTCIIPAVIQVFLNHYILRMEPLAAVQHPRVYHQLIPNVVKYENLTAIDGEHIELSEKFWNFLEQRGHQLKSTTGCSVCQFVVHDLQNPVPRKGGTSRWHEVGTGSNIFYGMLTAVSDPRKDGNPAGI